jgi:hypothetical protein
MFPGGPFPPEENAYASAQEDFTLLVTGGTGTGTYMMLAHGSYAGDAADTETYDVSFGDARIYGSPAGSSTQLFGTFTYGVPQPMNLSIGVGVDARWPAGVEYSASASFNGIVIVQDSVSRTPVPDAAVSLQLISELSSSPLLLQGAPEPSLSMAAGLCLLAFAATSLRRVRRVL